MAVRIRFQRHGKTGKAFYRLVAVDRRKKRDASPLEVLGWYNPADKENTLQINKERLSHWYKQGAVASETVWSLLRRHKISVELKRK